jgi:dTDP-glucose 4,6-dehydratase
MSRRTFVVTGGAGFTGRNFVHHWMQTGADALVNLDKVTYVGDPDNLSSLRR